MGGDYQLWLPVFFCGTLPYPISLPHSSFFDHSSPSPLEANRARNIARIRKHVCIGGSSISRPFYLGEAGSFALYWKNLRLIDHCINNNSTIIVIYRDVLYKAHRYNTRLKRRCMQRKMYLLIPLYIT